MEMNYPSLIPESAEDLQGLEQAERRTGRSDRVRMLRLLKSSTVPNVTQAAAVLGYTVRTLQTWWRAHRDGGLPGLPPSLRPAGGRERITPEAWQGGCRRRCAPGRSAASTRRRRICAIAGTSTTASMPSPSCSNAARPN
jgi:transposase-like protein